MEYRTVGKEVSVSFIEKKSEFIGHIKPVQTEQEAREFLEQKRSEYSDATHNVYAYILRENNTQRFSDAGEPHGTAGMPTLAVLQKENLTDVVCVVTRYFGGILLGAGGLVRAYSKSAKLAVDEAGIVEIRERITIAFSMPYNLYEIVLREIPAFETAVVDTAFEAEVKITATIEDKFLSDMQKRLSDVSAGRIIIKKVDD